MSDTWKPDFKAWAMSNASSSGTPPGADVALVYATLAQVEVLERIAASLELITGCMTTKSYTRNAATPAGEEITVTKTWLRTQEEIP